MRTEIRFLICLMLSAASGMIGLQLHWGVTYAPAQGSFSMSGNWKKPDAAFKFRAIGIQELK